MTDQTALVKRDTNGLPRLQTGDIDPLTLARVFAQSGYFADAQEAAQAAVKIIAGAELGIPAVASMVGIYIVQGRVTLSANLIAATIKRSGRYTYRVLELTDTACRIAFFEGGEQLGESSFTAEDAQRAGLWGKATWKQFPRNLLFARAMSNGARWFTADVFITPIYTPEELGQDVDEQGDMRQPPPRPRPVPAAYARAPEPVRAVPAPPAPAGAAAAEAEAGDEQEEPLTGEQLAEHFSPTPPAQSPVETPPSSPPPPASAAELRQARALAAHIHRQVTARGHNVDAPPPDADLLHLRSFIDTWQAEAGNGKPTAKAGR